MSQLPAQPAHHLTVREYFRLEEDSLEKHEYRDGELINMAGSTENHSLITANIIGEVRNRLKGSGCRVYDSNLRVRFGKKVRYAYPDATVICGESRYDPLDPRRSTVTNPRLIVEVLSESTEAYDRGEKFHGYLELPSFVEYVIVSQNKARVETLFRQPDGTWNLATFNGREAVARLRSLDIELSLSEIFAGIEFPPEPEVPADSKE